MKYEWISSVRLIWQAPKLLQKFLCWDSSSVQLSHLSTPSRNPLIIQIISIHNPNLFKEWILTTLNFVSFVCEQIQRNQHFQNQLWWDAIEMKWFIPHWWYTHTHTHTHKHTPKENSKSVDKVKILMRKSETYSWWFMIEFDLWFRSEKKYSWVLNRKILTFVFGSRCLDFFNKDKPVLNLNIIEVSQWVCGYEIESPSFFHSTFTRLCLNGKKQFLLESKSFT